MVGSARTYGEVSAFVRVRPLTPAELQKGATELPGLTLSSATEPEATAFDDTSLGGTSAITGFTGTLGCSASNRSVFEGCFEPQLETVLRGGTASLFCYGYTGSGKTHTVIGYGEEQGLCFLAAAKLLQSLEASSEKQGLFLQASVCELYNDEVFDLLGSDKVSCVLRVDDEGQLNVIGKQECVPLPISETAAAELEELLSPEQRQDQFATMITRAAGLRTASVSQVEGLQEIHRSCAQHRAVGSSTEHAQSSRSHCIFWMEVVNETVLKAQAAFDEAKATIAPRKNALDNVMLCRFKLLWADIGHGLFPPSAPIDKSDYLPMDPDSGFYDMTDGYAVDLSKGAVNGLLHLKGHEAKGPKSMEDWAFHFGFPELVFGMTRTRVQYDEPGRWEALKETLDLMSKEMRQRLQDANEHLDQATRDLEKARACGPKALGGRLLLVDLAGADHDHRSGKEQKESAAINKSLLSLKECLRSMAKVSKGKAKFRDSKLTRLLEDSLVPSACSQRRTRESVSVMLVNVSPAKHLGAMTLNALRYGQMFLPAGAYAQRAAPPKAAPPKAALREAIFDLYRKHCPEKSDEDVEVILRKFSGKEAELLQKAREKYLPEKDC